MKKYIPILTILFLFAFADTAYAKAKPQPSLKAQIVALKKENARLKKERNDARRLLSLHEQGEVPKVDETPLLRAEITRLQTELSLS